jgi:hypothetical protein
MPTKLMPAIIAALLLAALAAANIEPYNHPASCDACHYGATPSSDVSNQRGGHMRPN